MPHVLIVYATTEGQTRKIAQFLTDELIRRKCETTLVDASGAQGPNLFEGVDAVLIAASVHMHQYQSSIVHFVRDNCAALAARPNAFVSVSLAALGDDVEDQEEVADVVRHFVERTGWMPGEVIHAAGALKYTRYDFFKRWIMKRIAKDHGLPTETDDYEFTDWTALERFADRFAATLGQPA